MKKIISTDGRIARCLGKKPVRHDPRTFFLSDYLPVLPSIPAARDWTGTLTAWQMLGNDAVGDCTCASAGHCEMLWTNDAGTLFIPSTDQILADYSAITGYNPANPDSDQGADELSVLKYWRKNGIAGRKISAFVKVDMTNLDEVRAAIALFGAVYAGVQLPSNALDAFNAGQPWADVSDTNIEGGHAIPLVAYDADGFTCITWGAKQQMTNEWALKFADEGYVILSPDWISGGGSAPSGFDLVALQADLKSL
jgi:hypothetical protein